MACSKRYRYRWDARRIVLESLYDGEPNIHEDIVFFTNFTYVGKSKAKLEELFDVEVHD